MVGADRASGGQDDDVTKFFDCFWRLIEEITRQKFKDAWKEGRKNQMAAALQVSASTVGHWWNRENFPQWRHVETALTLVGATDTQRKALLELWESARLLWEANRSVPESADGQAAATGDSAAMNTEVPTTPAVPEDSGLGRTETKGVPTSLASSEMEGDATGVLCDADEANCLSSAEERNQNVMVSTQARPEVRDGPSRDGGAPLESSGQPG